MRVSAMIIAKNEAARITDCLESLAWVDEIVLVDDYSSDATAAIAKEHKAKVFQRYLDGYANQKNFGIKKAHNAWVLIIDADERVPKALQNEIRKLVPKKDVVAYSVPRKNYLGKKWLAHGGLYPDRHLRLINSRFCEYGPRQIHETIEANGKTASLRSPLVHLTYKNTWDYYKKVRKYAALEAAASETRPTYGDIFKTFYRKYFKLSGYKDGWAGLVSAKLLSYYEWRKRRAMGKQL